MMCHEYHLELFNYPELDTVFKSSVEMVNNFISEYLVVDTTKKLVKGIFSLKNKLTLFSICASFLNHTCYIH